MFFLNEIFQKDYSKKEDGRNIKKIGVVKIVGFLILLIIVLIQVFRIIFFDLTAISMVKI